MIEIKETEQSKLDYYKQKIDDKMKLALVISSLLALKRKQKTEYTYLNGNEVLEDSCNTESQHQFILMNLDKVIDEINETGYIIDFNNLYMLELEEELKKAKSSNKMTKEMTYIDDSYSSLIDIINLIEFSTVKTKFDLVSLLVEAKAHQVIMELLVSDKLKENEKETIILQLKQQNLNNLKEIFDVDQKENQVCRSERIKNMMPEVIAEFQKMLKNEFNPNDMIRLMIEAEKTNFDVFNFYVVNNIIDMASISYPTEQSQNLLLPKHKRVKELNEEYITINHLAMAYRLELSRTQEYLYSLPSYKEQNKKLKDDSDKYIIYNIATYYSASKLIKFTNHENYESTLEKVELILSLVEKYKEKFDRREINIILDNSITRAKEEDVEQIEEIIKIYKTNTDPETIKEKRGEFTKKLGVYRDHVIAKYPAGMKIGSITEK